MWETVEKQEMYEEAKRRDKRTSRMEETQRKWKNEHDEVETARDWKLVLKQNQ